MSFDPRFEARWNDVISPAIIAACPSHPLEPHRIDLGRRGDSILTEILDEIARCQLLIADMSTIGYLDGKPIRNANVLYELGLAHASRMPEEVLVIRSDSDPLPFDVTNVRVHSYSPDGDAAGSRSLLADLIADALQSIELTRSRTVVRTAELLDFECWDALYEIATSGPIGHPGRVDVVEQRMGVLQALPRIAGIQRLLELGAIAASLQRITPKHIGGYSQLPRQDLFRYELTRFGKALLDHCLECMDYFTPEVRRAFADARARDAAL